MKNVKIMSSNGEIVGYTPAPNDAPNFIREGSRLHQVYAALRTNKDNPRTFSPQPMSPEKVDTLLDTRARLKRKKKENPE